MNPIELFAKDLLSLKTFAPNMNGTTIQKPEVLAAICRIGAIAMVAFGLFSSPIGMIFYGIAAHDLYKYGCILDNTIKPGVKSLFAVTTTFATTLWRGGSVEEALESSHYTLLRQNLISVQIYHAFTQRAPVTEA